MKKIFLLKLILIFISIVSCDGCIDPDECPDTFNVPAEIIPYQRQYHIGDTITLFSKFDRHVHEIRTDRKYDMININWFPNTYIQFIDTIGGANTILSKYFKLILDTKCKEYISTTLGVSGIDCNYTFENDSFSLTYKFIPKRTGNFFLSQKCAIGPNFNEQDFPGKCRNYGYYVIVDMNSGKDGNIDILESAKDSLYNHWVLSNPKTRFYERGGFCLTVVP